jgi:YidC/Oxa1 family membrane protein insertase
MSRAFFYQTTSFLRHGISCCLLLLSLVSFAQASPSQLDEQDKGRFLSSSSEFINSSVKESFDFFGLATYFNDVNYFLVSDEKIVNLREVDAITTTSGQWILAVGRFKVLAAMQEGLKIQLADSGLLLSQTKKAPSSSLNLWLLDKNKLSELSPHLNSIRYQHLWAPLAWLSRTVEAAIVVIHQMGASWGVSIILLSIFLKFFLFPLNLWTTKVQQASSKVQSSMEPELTIIKSKYDGEQAHNLIMQVYKDHGVSPFYAMKPILASFIQIPILIAVFNALGEMPQLDGESFLWIENLAQPDALFTGQYAISMLGNSFNALPIIMTFIAVASTIAFRNLHASPLELRRQKRNLYVMAAIFLILFYPFPAAMVLFWTTNNLIQIGQQKLTTK